MITIGIDPHKDTHTAAAVKDATGELLGELTVAGTEEGHEHLRAWAHGLAREGSLRFALEDCRHVNGRLERFLLAASEPVVRVGTRMTARERRGARTSASQMRSTPSRLLGRPCESRACRWPPTTRGCAS